MIDVVTQAIKKIVENGVMIYGDGKTPLVLRSIKKKDLGMTEVVHLPEDTKIKRTTYPVLNSTQITEGQPTSKYPSTLNGRPL